MNTEKENNLEALLEQLGIAYTRHEHPPVYTVEEAEKYWQNIEGTHCKNLFLRNNKGNRHFLVVLEQSRQVDLKKLGETSGAGKLSFASAKRLENYLGLETGSVSPFGLINDEEKQVEVIMDKTLQNSKVVNFHPNVNTATLSLSYEDFIRFLKHCGNAISYI